jgi:hypothetical protein
MFHDLLHLHFDVFVIHVAQLHFTLSVYLSYRPITRLDSASRFIPTRLSVCSASNNPMWLDYTSRFIPHTIKRVFSSLLPPYRKYPVAAAIQIGGNVVHVQPLDLPIPLPLQADPPIDNGVLPLTQAVDPTDAALSETALSLRGHIGNLQTKYDRDVDPILSGPWTTVNSVCCVPWW